jgi:hypothetical protein
MVDFNSLATVVFLRTKHCVAAILLCCASPVAAEGVKHSDGSVAELRAMLPGEQRVLTNHSATMMFAGRSITFSGFTGLLGYASDVAYVAVTDGSASLANQVATPGRMIILPPFGEQVSVVRFDARRLMGAMEQPADSALAPFHASLQPIARSQSRGIFLGSLGRTNFNVATSGQASQELARRSIVGGTAVQDIRYGDNGDRTGLEKAVVTRFLSALVSGDIATTAQLMDPLPFGLTDMRGVPGDARNVAALHLIFGRNWQAALGTATPEFDSARSVWVIAGQVPVTITLRSTQDIPFIKSIRIGDGQ